MNEYIDLERHFRDLSAQELDDPDVLVAHSDYHLGGTMDWNELLMNPRVVLLAEAGAGKTREMFEQSERLAAEGKFAFFIPLEGLHHSSLVDLFTVKKEEAFTAWKADGQSLGWFFLDAVDELKLTEGKLDSALLRFAKAIDGHLGRANVVVSCRPYDWRASFDLATVRNRLPLPASVSERVLSSGEAFMEPLRQQRREARDAAKNDRPVEDIKTVFMVPMSDRQIRLFAEGSGISDADAFLSELSRQNAWTFARRPFDLLELVQTWATEGHLGTRAQQHEANVTAKLRDHPDRQDQGILSDDKARLGAERLALALALTRTRTIQSPDQPLDAVRADGVLDPATILRDWSVSERHALLRRGLFDPATYGRVRFHHRSVQEYLAARRLKGLRDRSMPVKALFRLLFGERYGINIVLPSMRTIASWLALWDADVRDELTKREPEALLTLGDPESLVISDRAKLLRTFVTAYGTGGWRGLNIPIDEVRRLSHPKLAAVIRELWGDGPSNDDVRELLIEVIWKGPVEACADLAESAARNTSWKPYPRIIAILALVACKQLQLLRSIADNIFVNPADWPARVIYGVVADLFPQTLSVRELAKLIRSTPEPKKTVGGFSRALQSIVDEIEPQSPTGIALRNMLAWLIFHGRKNQNQEFHHLRSKFDYLSPALARLCQRQLSAASSTTDIDLVRSCIVAFRFRDHYKTEDAMTQLQAEFQRHPQLRGCAFWEDLRLMGRVVSAKDDSNRAHHVQDQSLLGRLIETDQPWLEAALTDVSRPKRRPIALFPLIDLWYQRGRNAAELDALRALVPDETVLQKTLNERTANPNLSWRQEKNKRDARRRECIWRAKEERRLNSWQTWRDKLCAHPNEAFSNDRAEQSIADLYTWLEQSPRESARYSVWNKGLVSRAFGPEVASEAEQTFINIWRDTRPTLWSKRPAQDRSSVPYKWIYGLCGLMAESSRPAWTKTLTSDEARLAAVYSTVEMNGLAPFVTSLVESHPQEVEAILGGELSAQLSLGADDNYLPMLQDLSYADHSLKNLLKPRLLSTLPAWPTTFSPQSETRWAHHLDQALRVLRETCDEAEAATVANQCATRYAQAPEERLALTWLKALFLFDAPRAARTLASVLSGSVTAPQRSRAIQTFAALFGEHDAVMPQIADPAMRADMLGQLIRSVYAFVRCKDDQEREGMYTPDTRDHAERARNFLLSALLETPGSNAQRTLMALADESDFLHFPDRLRLLARQRAATDAEFEPFYPQAIVELESRCELPPHDRDGLFQVMMDRLDGLAHDFSHHDFSDRKTVRSIASEAEMQRTLATRLDGKANGIYTVGREEEVADGKETDIRLSATLGKQKAVAEVKLADKYTVTELEYALRNQLVGQYLRHEHCKAGCLLLTYNGQKKRWQHPVTKLLMTFPALLEHLSKQARALEVENNHSVRLAIFGLDLTDPQLAPTRPSPRKNGGKTAK